MCADTLPLGLLGRQLIGLSPLRTKAFKQGDVPKLDTGLRDVHSKYVQPQ